MISSAFILPLSWLFSHFADLSRLSSSALIAAIWQGTLLAITAALVLRLVPRIPAAARFAIWFAVFSLIAALPFLGLTPHVSSAISPGANAHAWLRLDSRWTFLIAAIWVVASFLRAATLITAALRVHTLSRHAIPIAPSPSVDAAATRGAQLCSSADVDRPTVIGFFSPKILIPVWLLEKLTPAELEHVMLHESGHLNRADDWLNLLQKLALVFFPLNPALAWVERRLCFERELACDERVLAVLAARDCAATGYASSLASLAEYRLQRRGLVVRAAVHDLALALGAIGRESELGRRITRILRPDARMKPFHIRLATAATMASLLFAATELEHCPQMVSFANPSHSTQIASVTPAIAPDNLLHGYRAVAARISFPAAPQMKPIGDAAPHIAAASYPTVHVRVASASTDEVRATNVRDVPNRQPAYVARMVAASAREPQDHVVITRWTVWQSSDGSRMIRATAVLSDVPSIAEQPSDLIREHQTRNAYPVPVLRAQEISQSISPYAAVPVPGGWLVFQL